MKNLIVADAVKAKLKTKHKVELNEVAQCFHNKDGRLLTDNRAGTTTTYTYNKRNRLASATSGALM